VYAVAEQQGDGVAMDDVEMEDDIDYDAPTQLLRTSISPQAGAQRQRGRVPLEARATVRFEVKTTWTPAHSNVFWTRAAPQVHAADGTADASAGVRPPSTAGGGPRGWVSEQGCGCTRTLTSYVASRGWTVRTIGASEHRSRRSCQGFAR
jgi:hypothetical protein